MKRAVLLSISRGQQCSGTTCIPAETETTGPDMLPVQSCLGISGVSCVSLKPFSVQQYWLGFVLNYITLDNLMEAFDVRNTCCYETQLLIYDHLSNESGG